MMIEIAASGGFTGMGPPAKTVEVDGLEPGLRSRVCEAFAPDNLRRLSHDGLREADHGAADGLLYEITVREGGGRDRFTVPEGRLPSEMLDLMDDL